MRIENPPNEHLNRVAKYSQEVLAKMYPQGRKGMKFADAIRQVLTNNYITDEADVSRLMREIGEYIKTRGDLKRREKEAVKVPVAKSLESVKKPQKPYEDSFSKARRLHRERELKANPLFADQVNEEINEEQRRGF
jgi:hypothetical protein